MSISSTYDQLNDFHIEESSKPFSKSIFQNSTGPYRTEGILVKTGSRKSWDKKCLRILTMISGISNFPEMTMQWPFESVFGSSQHLHPVVIIIIRDQVRSITDQEKSPQGIMLASLYHISLSLNYLIVFYSVKDW